MTDRETVRRALYDAIGWQQGLVEAYAHIAGAPEAEEARQQIRLYRSLLKRRYGQKHGNEPASVNNAELVGLAAILAAAEPSAEAMDAMNKATDDTTSVYYPKIGELWEREAKGSTIVQEDAHGRKWFRQPDPRPPRGGQ